MKIIHADCFFGYFIIIAIMPYHLPQEMQDFLSMMSPSALDKPRRPLPWRRGDQGWVRERQIQQVGEFNQYKNNVTSRVIGLDYGQLRYSYITC